MASKRTVPALRTALNSFKTSSPALRQIYEPLRSSRGLSIHSSRPRNLALTSRSSVRYASSEAKEEQLGKTGLYELHAQHGAKFVPFGGYYMPVQYNDLSIVESHNWTREKASLFDVGHM
jgi:aminomethyltransferase